MLLLLSYHHYSSKRNVCLLFILINADMFYNCKIPYLSALTRSKSDCSMVTRFWSPPSACAAADVDACGGGDVAVAAVCDDGGGEVVVAASVTVMVSRGSCCWASCCVSRST